MSYQDLLYVVIILHITGPHTFLVKVTSFHLSTAAVVVIIFKMGYYFSLKAKDLKKIIFNYTGLSDATQAE